MRVFYYPIEQKLTLPEDGVQYMSYGLCAYLIFGFSAMQLNSYCIIFMRCLIDEFRLYTTTNYRIAALQKDV